MLECDFLSVCPENSYCDFDSQPPFCREHACGDNIVSPIEDCDDGNEILGDGCEMCLFAPADEGFQCRPDSLETSCAEGLICDRDTSTCILN